MSSESPESTANGDVQAKVLAASVLEECAEKISQASDTFSGWILAGFAGSFSLLLANIGSLHSLSAPGLLSVLGWLLIVVLVIGVIERYLATVVTSSAATARQTRTLGENYSGDDLDLAISVVFSELKAATLWPLKGTVSRSLDKVCACPQPNPGFQCLWPASERLTGPLEQVASKGCPRKQVRNELPRSC